jgi:hypothetical protein
MTKAAGPAAFVVTDEQRTVTSNDHIDGTAWDPAPSVRRPM